MKIKQKFAVLALVTILGLGSAAVLTNNQTIVSAKTKKHKRVVKKHYAKASLKLPAGYNRKELLSAFKNRPSTKFIKACAKGMQTNNFSNNRLSENAKDDKTKVNLAKLTKSQQKELSDFSLRLINQARKGLKLKAWKNSKGVTKLADAISAEYQTHHRSIKDHGHYVAGIVRACQKNGLNLNDNYVEDLAGFYSKNSKTTMTQLKKDVYFGLKQMIFGYAGASDKSSKNMKYYREWQHAGDLFNTQGSKHDGDYNYYGFSMSKTGNVYSMHFISVPNFIVNSKVYNRNFRI